MAGNRATMRHSRRMNSVALAFAVYGKFARGSLLTDASLLRIARSEEKKRRKDRMNGARLLALNDDRRRVIIQFALNMIRRVWSPIIHAHFTHRWVKKIVDIKISFSLSLCVTHPERSPGVNRVNSSLPARIRDRSPSGRAPLDDARYFKNFPDG